MKNFIYVAVLSFMFVACGSNANTDKCAKDSCCGDSIVATDIVPAAATEVLPAAAPSAENGGKVATEVIPDAPAK